MALHAGVPAWLSQRAAEIMPRGRRLTKKNQLKLLLTAQVEVIRWLKEMDIPRTLDLFEMFCGKGGTSDLVASAGGAARKFDRSWLGAN